MEFHFRRHFRLRPKVKNAFRSASSIHHKKSLVLVLRCKVLVLVLNTRLSLGLGLERILVLVLVLKKSLDYITATIPPGPLCLIPPTAHVMQRLIWPQKLCTSSPLFNMEHWYHKPIFLVILLKHENEKNATKEYHHLQATTFRRRS